MAAIPSNPSSEKGQPPATPGNGFGCRSRRVEWRGRGAAQNRCSSRRHDSAASPRTASERFENSRCRGSSSCAANPTVQKVPATPPIHATALRDTPVRKPSPTPHLTATGATGSAWRQAGSRACCFMSSCCWSWRCGSTLLRKRRRVELTASTVESPPLEDLSSNDIQPLDVTALDSTEMEQSTEDIMSRSRDVRRVD